MIKLKLTTIQISEGTKEKLGRRKSYPRESYESIIKRVLESDDIPSMEEMFRIGDGIKQKRQYTTAEIIKLSHELRGKR